MIGIFREIPEKDLLEIIKVYSEAFGYEYEEDAINGCIIMRIPGNTDEDVKSFCLKTCLIFDPVINKVPSDEHIIISGSLEINLSLKSHGVKKMLELVRFISSTKIKHGPFEILFSSSKKSEQEESFPNFVKSREIFNMNSQKWNTN